MANRSALEYLVNGSASLKRKWKGVVDACKRIPIPGANITVTETPDGPAFNALIIEPNDFRSWVVITYLDPDKNPKLKVGDGTILQSWTPNDLLELTGTGDEMVYNKDNDLVWIEIDFDDDGVPTEGTVKGKGNGDSGFDPTADAWTVGSWIEHTTDEPYIQTKLRIPIFVSQSDGGSTTTEQLTVLDLMLDQRCPAGIPGIVPVASPYKGFDF